MRISVHPTPASAGDAVGREVADRAEAGSLRVLGVATGSTPIPVYRALAARRGPALARLSLFALDEYVGLEPGHPQSYRRVVEREVGEPLGIDPSRIHLPDAADPGAYDALIAEAGGVDVQILGVGHNGHIGFNEPGSPFDSRTRITPLDASTRAANARFFDGPDQVPSDAVTQGIGTIMRARRIVVLAFGRSKAEIVAAAITGPLTESVPASVLREHPDVTWFLDGEAAADLPRELLDRADSGSEG